MAVRTTTWRPDTCGCEIVYEWNDAATNELRIHTPKSAKSCPEHSGSPAEIYSLVLAENVLKNKGLAEINSALPLLEADALRWSFDGERNIAYVVPGLTALEKSALQTVLTSKLGGKVSLA